MCETSRPLTHECGVFAVVAGEGWSQKDVSISELLCLGLSALQHRGQESAGIATMDDAKIHVHKDMGMVSKIFNDENVRKLRGNIGIGHTRYSTCAGSNVLNVQPFTTICSHGPIAMAHNGQIVNNEYLRQFLIKREVSLQTHSDSELIIKALSLKPPGINEEDGANWLARIRHLMKLTSLSYSLVIMVKDRLYAVRDPYGNRPLCLGKLPVSKNQLNDTIQNEHEAWIVSSESGAFLKYVDYVREVQPGEIVEVTERGFRSLHVVNLPQNETPAFCIFEYVYFARLNSVFEGQTVLDVRIRCGKRLAVEHPVEADIVSSIPHSADAAAQGYSAESGIPFGTVLERTRFKGRTFIQPTQEMRDSSVKQKFGPVVDAIKNKRIILIDDSIVRGTTIKNIIAMLRDSGAKEIHVRVASPPLRHPCYMGINIPTQTELVANKYTSRELAAHIKADSVEYLSLEGLKSAVQNNAPLRNENVGHCTACLTGKYPAAVFDW